MVLSSTSAVSAYLFGTLAILVLSQTTWDAIVSLSLLLLIAYLASSRISRSPAPNVKTLILESDSTEALFDVSHLKIHSQVNKVST